MPHPTSRIGNSNLAEEIGGRGDRFARPHVAVDAQGLAYLPTRPVDRVQRGHRVLEDHGHLGPADGLHLVLAEIRQHSVFEPDASFDDPACARQEPHDRERGHRFPGAGLADDAKGFSGIDRERDSIDGAKRAFAQRKLGVDVLQLEQVTERHQRRSLESSASRSESPSRLKLYTVIEMATPGMMSSHGSCGRKERPVVIICPQSGVGGWAPRPRKERTASARIANPADSETCTRTGFMRVGMWCRRTMRTGVAPSDRVATTNSIGLS